MWPESLKLLHICIESAQAKGGPNFQRKHRQPSHCPNHAPTGAGKWTSSKLLIADRNREPERHPESRPHDETPILCPFTGPTLTVLVEGRLWLIDIEALQQEPNQSRKTYKSALWRAKGRAAEQPNLASPAKLKPIPATGASAFPIARRTHPAVSTLGDFSTLATLPRPNPTHWPELKTLDKAGFGLIKTNVRFKIMAPLLRDNSCTPRHHKMNTLGQRPLWKVSF